MNKDNRFWKIALPALLAMVMAGAAVCALAGALGLAVNAALVYAAALLTAVLFALATVSVPMLLVSSAAGVLLLGGIIAAQSDGLRQMGALWTALSTGGSLDGAMQAARLVQLLAAVAFSGVLFLLLSRSGATAFALVIEGAALIGGYAMRPEMSLAAAIPGVAAALCAFALSGGLPGTRARGGFWCRWGCPWRWPSPSRPRAEPHGRRWRSWLSACARPLRTTSASPRSAFPSR